MAGLDGVGIVSLVFKSLVVFADSGDCILGFGRAGFKIDSDTVLDINVYAIAYEHARANTVIKIPVGKNYHTVANGYFIALAEEHRRR